MGLLPAERVEKIRAGSGPYDTARDLVDLVGLYREFAEVLGGEPPFTEAWFAETETVVRGSWPTSPRPGRRRSPPTPPTPPRSCATSFGRCSWSAKRSSAW